MIHTIRMLHYLSPETYRQIGEALGLDTGESRIDNNFVLFPEGSVTRIHLFNILYKTFGRIWFMHVTAEFPRFRCERESFIPALYGHYAGLFGRGVMAGFPGPEEANCDYVEYAAALDAADAGAAMEILRGRLQPEQLDRALWGQYEKPHSTPVFLAHREDGRRIAIMVKCHGTALKRIVKDAGLHHATGLRLPAAVSRETESFVLNQLVQRNLKDTAIERWVV